MPNGLRPIGLVKKQNKTPQTSIHIENIFYNFVQAITQRERISYIEKKRLDKDHKIDKIIKSMDLWYEVFKYEYLKDLTFKYKQ